MLPFISTRGASRATLAEALDHGLAPDGGLYVPADLPAFGAPPRDLSPTFTDTARWAARVLAPDVDAVTLDAAVSAAFDFPVPIVEVEPDLFVLELFHGPTHAFKDIGARFMANLMARLLPAAHTRTILVATSGDTGGAVAAAFHGLPGFRVVILFPRNGISERQRRQMTTLGGNVTAVAVDGTFDDCQRLAKEAFRDASARERFALSSANSINVGRLLPQAFYYVHAALALGWEARRARFVVPCGNLGNLCAGLLAHHCGMPAAGFVAATNANDGFVEFLRSGGHTPRPSIATISNAMDVGDPSNLERIRWLYRGADDRLRREVRGVSVSDGTTAECIADVYGRTGYVLDPHTAVAYHAALRQAGERSPAEPAVVLATAHPAKFPDVVERAIGAEVPLPDGLGAAMDRSEQAIGLTPDLASLVRALEDLESATGAEAPLR